MPVEELNPSNVAIFPIQIIHKADSSRSKSAPLEVVPFPEVDFEDCSSYVNLRRLAHRLVHHENHQSDNVMVSDTEDDDDEVTFVSMSNGKRKASSPTEATSRKQHKDDFTTLTSTLCRFRIHSHKNDERKLVKAIQLAKTGCTLSEISFLRFARRSNVVEEDSIMTTALEVIDEQGELVAILPIVGTDKIDISRSPHRLTNGKWLEAAVVLCSGHVGKRSADAVRMEATLVRGEMLDAQSVERMDEFLMELHISVHISLDRFIPAGTASPPWLADHLHRLMRFCSPNDEAEEKIRSKGELTASSIYSLLPSSKLPPLDTMQPVLLNPSLYPFQMRSVNFLLGREGKRVRSKTEEGDVVLEDIDGIMAHDGVQQVGLWWHEARIGDDVLYYNPLFGKVTRNIKETQTHDISGGILAEEMGLGKTVEVLALILLNQDEARSALPSYYDNEREIEISPTKTTLIVAPENLRQQWIDEIALHAPHLRVFSYSGYQAAHKDVPPDIDWRDYLKRFDVMVASFDTLKKEINVAKKAPNRSMRFERKYERPRSLLIQLAFHRVVMDEVQMVGHSYAAETVSMIDRRYSLAVSGTPIKAIKDLKSLFFFLRVLTPGLSRHWDRLLLPAMFPSLVRCFAILATRHTKAQVQSEMTLPPQTRTLVPINFTAIETAFYKDIYSRALQSLDVDLDDFSNNRDLFDTILKRFDEDLSQLRNTLTSLRQACTHPQIAGSHVRSGNYLAGTALATSNTIRSMDEVLTIMIEGSKADQATVWQQMARKKIHRTVLLLQDKSNEGRLVIAREMLTSLVSFIKARIIGVEEDAKRARYIGPLYRFDKSELSETETSDNELASGELVEIDQPHLFSDATQADRDKEHEMAERRLHRSRHMTVISARWRYFTEQLHRAHHFLGNVYFQMGEAQKANEAKQSQVQSKQPSEDSNTKTEVGSSIEVATLKKLEDEAYDRAEEVRVKLLQISRKVVDTALLSLDRSPVSFTLNGLGIDVDIGLGGIQTEDIFDQLIMSINMLNRQAEMLFDWRNQILQRLRKPVSRDVSEEDELDDQYQENLDAQAEAEALTEMYRMVLNQREFLLSGVRIAGSIDKPALFVELERHFRAKKKMGLLMLTDPDNEAVRRQLENAPTEEQEEVMKLQLNHFERLDQQQKKVFEEEEDEDDSEDKDSAAITTPRLDQRKSIIDLSGEQLSKEDELLSASESEIRTQRKGKPDLAIVIKDESRALDSIMKKLRDKMQSLERNEELAIARMAMDKMRPIISNQKVMCEKLKKEHLLFMALFNARSNYFKQIQELSDHVSDIATENIAKEIAALQEEELALKGREEQIAGRLRYLRAIEEEEGDVGETYASIDGPTRTCIICTDPLIKAVIFNTCGHSTCENCFKKWTLKHGQCPMCKTRVSMRDAYHVTYDASGRGKKRQVQLPQADRRQRQQARFNIISEHLARGLAVMSIKSALGSKLDLLTRHLMYIEHTKPGTKSLIFTAFSRGIALVGDALRSNKIRYVTLDKGGGKASRVIDRFKNDPNINVLLLHSEAQSSGLNLNVCENVFLLEPLVNHSIELQAIGRVHRIGQTKETSIFVYQVNDTVEERIVQLAADRGQSLVTKENSISQDSNINDTAEMTARTHEGQGKVNGKKDGEFVASIEEILQCLFENEEEDVKIVSSMPVPSSSPSSLVKSKEEEERDRMRKERIMAIERRQAMSSLTRERDQHR